jgi:hypothetical protein
VYENENNIPGRVEDGQVQVQRPALTAKRLRELLSYDRATGHFTWRLRKVLPRKLGWRQRIFNASIAGKRAGYVHKDGNVHIHIDRRRYQAHRLAWLWVHGTLPAVRGIEHRDRDRANNAIDNLKLLPPVAPPKPKLGPPASHWIYWDKARALWCAEVTVGGASRHLSPHVDFEEAVAASKAVALEERVVA